MSVMNTLSDLKRLVRGPAVAPGNRRATVIAVAARKGGVGKTTTTVNLGADLARYHGCKVLLIDMDAQGHVEMSLRAETRGRATETLSDVLLGRKRDVQELVQPTSIDGLWFVGSDAGLNTTEVNMATRMSRETLLADALRVARTHFDMIVIDCPPNLGTLTVNALVAADRVLIPCDLSTLSLDGVEALLAKLFEIQERLNPRLDLLGLVRTRVDRRNRSMNGQIEATLAERYGHFLLPVEIGVSTAIAKAQHAGRPLSVFSEDSRGAIGYRALADLVYERLM